jgi:hypothetical protein
MEHGVIIQLVEAALRQMSGEFTNDDLANKVLAAHPDVDRARLRRCVEIVIRRHDGLFHPEEDEALWEQQQAHAETLPPEDGLAYLKKCMEERRQEFDLRTAKFYLMRVEMRAVGPHGFDSGATWGDCVRKLGVECYVAAVREELAKDGHVDCLSVPSCDEGAVSRWDMPEVIDYLHRRAALRFERESQ